MLLINKSYLQVFLFYLLTLNQKNKTLYIVFEEKPSFIFLKYVNNETFRTKLFKLSIYFGFLLPNKLLIENYLSEIDLVLIMSVEPGFSGQKFMPEVLSKTKILKKMIKEKNLKVDIEIDGGINFENCSKAKNAGANILVSGSTIFKENKGDLKKNIEILRNN